MGGGGEGRWASLGFDVKAPEWAGGLVSLAVADDDLPGVGLPSFEGGDVKGRRQQAGSEQRRGVLGPEIEVIDDGVAVFWGRSPGKVCLEGGQWVCPGRIDDGIVGRLR